MLSIIRVETVRYKQSQTDFLDASLPPNTTGIPYTIPAIQLPTGEWLMDSRKVAERLEDMYARPTARVKSEIVAKVEKLTDRIMQTVCADFIPKIPRNLLGERSLDYWYRTREEWFDGKPLDQVAAEMGGDQVYDAARPDVGSITALLKQNSAGPFFEGETITYADFIWASFLHFFENLDIECLYKLVGPDAQSHLALLEACRPWLQRNDH